MAPADKSLKFVLLVSCSLIVLNLFCIDPVHALDLGLKVKGPAKALVKHFKCSRKCESEFCKVPPLLRYGKYCGLLYGGCPGEKPCDALDACCMDHDACVGNKNHGYGYLNKECSRNLLKCMAKVKKSGAETFKGSKCQAGEVIDVITDVIKVALGAGKFVPPSK
ncbi:phospholipase A2-alpha-like [Juglans microcarpa x Juglans regia]|uniref:phospholipase A2-alpha-like n=1 Tax=Juglans microcarpa x Juglans regia TaxID=2249226 RepID=UPI001B7EB42C|nr:phospholipase A2-alpha-like [Juglans microcarpa x Juglans regia]